MSNFATPIDIAKRLFRKKSIWYHGLPKVSILGEEGSFGKLLFDFGDEIIEFNIYLINKGDILSNAQLAILNFDEIINEEYKNQW